MADEQMDTTGGADTPSGMDRRSLLKKAAVGGAVLAVAPAVLSSAASAAGSIECVPVPTEVEIGISPIVTVKLITNPGPPPTKQVLYLAEHLNFEFVPSFKCVTTAGLDCPQQADPTYLSKTWIVDSDTMSPGGKAIGVQAFGTGTPPAGYATTPIPANANEISVISTSDRTLYDLLRTTTNVAVTLQVVADCLGTTKCFGQRYTLNWNEGPTNAPGNYVPVNYEDVPC